MRKLKLQVQLSVDGFSAQKDGQLDWITWDWDDKIKEYVSSLTDSIDTILLGRKMTDGFISHWSSLLNKPNDPGFEFAKKMINTPKVVFTKTLNSSEWINTVLAKGKLEDEIQKLKQQPGKGIIVYGGSSFVSSLIRAGLIDEYHLFINPAVIGNGIPIFDSVENRLFLKLVNSIKFDCGIVLNHYEPQ